MLDKTYSPRANRLLACCVFCICVNFGCLLNAAPSESTRSNVVLEDAKANTPYQFATVNTKAFSILEMTATVAKDQICGADFQARILKVKIVLRSLLSDRPNRILRRQLTVDTERDVFSAGTKIYFSNQRPSAKSYPCLAIANISEHGERVRDAFAKMESAKNTLVAEFNRVPDGYSITVVINGHMTVASWSALQSRQTGSEELQNTCMFFGTMTASFKEGTEAVPFVKSSPAGEIEPIVCLTNRNAVLSLAFSSDGSVLLTGGGDFSRTVRVWNTRTWEIADEFIAHLNSVNGVCSVDNKGHKIITSGDDGRVRLWDRKNLSVSDVQTEGCWCSAVATCRQFIAVGDLKNNRIMYTGVDRRGNSNKDGMKAFGCLLRLIEGHPAAMVEFSRDSKTVATAGFDNRLCLWSMETGTKTHVLGKANEHKLPPPNGPFLMSVDFSFDDKLVAVGSTDGTCTVWSVIDKKKMSEWKLAGSRGVSQAVFLPGNKCVAVATADGKLRIWPVGGDRPLGEIGLSGMCWKMAVSPNGKLLATAVADGTVKIFEVEDILALLK